MKDKKLTSMVDFIEQLGETSTFDTLEIDWYNFELSKLEQIRNYANFLKLPLTLGMFVPCDEKDNILTQPCDIINTDGCRDCACREYKKAKDKVLFQGFKITQERQYPKVEMEQDRLDALFDYCKNNWDEIKISTIKHEGFSEDGTPLNPIYTGIKLQ